MGYKEAVKKLIAEKEHYKNEWLKIQQYLNINRAMFFVLGLSLGIITMIIWQQQ